MSPFPIKPPVAPPAPKKPQKPAPPHEPSAPPPPHGPPCLGDNLKAEFKSNDKYFTSKDSKNAFLNQLRPICDYLVANPSEKYMIHIHTNLEQSTIFSWFGGRYASRPIGDLLYGRYNEIMRIILYHYPTLSKKNFGYQAHYNSYQHVEIIGRNCN